jgi:drug/metabolite transporter (DMT)-like permease
MMSTQRLLGIVLLLAGAALVVVGMNASDSLADRASNFFTGQFTDSTMWYLFGGIAVACAGLLLLVRGRRISSL